MKIELNNPPRTYPDADCVISDYGKIKLENNEMVSIFIDTSQECDVTAKPWGLYLGSSCNARMKENGFKVGLVRGAQGKLFVNAVNEGKVAVFLEYLDEYDSKLICWLDEFDLASGDSEAIFDLIRS